MFFIRIIKFLLKLLMYGFIGFIAFVFIIGIIIGSDFDDYDSQNNEYIKVIDNENDTINGETEAGVKYLKTWYDFDNDMYSEEFYFLKDDFERAQQLHNSISTEWNYTSDFIKFCQNNQRLWDRYPNAIYWSYVYSSLVKNDAEYLDSLYTILDDIKIRHKPNYRKFAEIIITFVQDIPYTFVHEKSCDTDIAARKAAGTETFEDYHYTNCAPNVRFALHSPVEFCYTQKGDCDTRAVLLFLVLTHYSYDAAVLYSREYAHAILGVKVPVGSNYIEFENKKYYTVETTAQNWQIGELPPSYSNHAYWKVILTSDILKQNNLID